MTEFDKMDRINLRKLKAERLTSAVMTAIGGHLCDCDSRRRRDVYEALLDVSYHSGVEILTDATRAEAGLPARGPDGWTLEEIAALEQRRLALLLKRPDLDLVDTAAP